MSGFRRVLLAFTVAVLAATPALSGSGPAAAATQSGQLTGVVRDQLGAALSDATVWLTPPSQSDSVAAVRTDAAGRYTLAAPAGTYDVRVATTLAGTRYAARVNDIAVGAASDLDIVVVRLVRFSGTVRDGSGTPLSGVIVYHGSGAGMKTGSDGAFSFSVTPGTWPLVAHLQIGADYGSVSASVENFTLSADRHQDLVFPVRPFEFTVTDPSGWPMTSGRVELFGGDQCHSGCPKDIELFPGGPASVGQHVRGSLGADGRVRLMGIDKPGNILRVPDYGPRPFTLIHTIPSPAPATVAVSSPTVTLEGMVRDSAGQLLRGAQVSLSNAGSTSSNYSDTNGRYVADHPVGDYELRLFHSSRPATRVWHDASLTIAHLNLPAGGRTQDLTLPGAPFTVKIVGADNQPLSGVVVRVSSDDNVDAAPGLAGVLNRHSTATTGSDGTVSAHIAPGDRTVSVHATLSSTGPSVQRVVDPAAGPAVISLATSGRPSVSGVVRDAAGTPISGLSVILYPADDNPADFTDEQGAYTAASNRPGQLTLRVNRGDHSAPPTETLPAGSWSVEAPVDVSGHQTVDMTIPRGGSADVRMTMASGADGWGEVNIAAADVGVSLGGSLHGTASTAGKTFQVGYGIRPALFGPTTVSVRWYSGAQSFTNPPNRAIVVSGIPLAPGGHLAVATAMLSSAEPPPTPSTTAPPTSSSSTSSSSTSSPTSGPPATTGTTAPSGTTGTTAPSLPITKSSNGSGYWMLGRDGKVYAFGDAQSYGDGPSGAPAVDLEPTPSGKGYWLVNEAGVVTARGEARSFGDVKAGLLAKGEKVTSLSATPAGRGYWIFTDRGRVVAFGDAGSFGDVSGTKLNGPVLDSVPTPSGKGYYMVASDGGIFAFGDARFYGSMGGVRLNAAVQSLVPDPDGVGYWLVASDGGVFAFDASFRGSMGGTPLNRPMTGMVRFGNGYLMVGEDGGIFNFSDKTFYGSLGGNPPAVPIVAVAVLE